jgi:hypothetical protein
MSLCGDDVLRTFGARMLLGNAQSTKTLRLGAEPCHHAGAVLLLLMMVVVVVSPTSSGREFVLSSVGTVGCPSQNLSIALPVRRRGWISVSIYLFALAEGWKEREEEGSRGAHRQGRRTTTEFWIL